MLDGSDGVFLQTAFDRILTRSEKSIATRTAVRGVVSIVFRPGAAGLVEADVVLSDPKSPQTHPYV